MMQKVRRSAVKAARRILGEKTYKKIRVSIIEAKIHREEKIRYGIEAKKAISKVSGLKETERKVLFKKWYSDYKKYAVTYSEYCQYDFQNRKEEEKERFISVPAMQKLYRLYGDQEVRAVFWDKVRFLETFHEYVIRDWKVVKPDQEGLQELLDKECLLKPINGTRGKGIAKPAPGTKCDQNFIEKYDGWLAEECIDGDIQIEEFHPSSLNTIRVVTFSNRGETRILGACFRMGNHGAFVDNGHGGGIFAHIDVETGVVDSDGINEEGKHFKIHPISKKVIKGFVIPCWDDIRRMCHRACSVVPGIRFAGWDVAVRRDGRLEFVEGNHAPDFDIMQAPLNLGMKELVLSTMRELKMERLK